MPAIGITFPFETLSLEIEGKPYELFGTVSVVGDRVTWRVAAIDVFAPDGHWSFRPKVESELFQLVRAALLRQCASSISDRMNEAVERGGGYEVLFGEAMPRDRFWRGVTRREPSTEDVVWLEAA